MNFKTTIGLLVALIVVLGVALLMPSQDPGAPKADTTAAKPLLQLKEADVASISIERADGRKLALQREGTAWKITAPLTAPAESWRVSGLLRDLLGATSRGDSNAAIDAPRFTIQITTTAGKAHTLRIADRPALGDNLLIQVDDARRPAMTSASLFDALDKPASDYRVMKLVDTAEDQITRIEIRRPGEAAVVLRKHDNAWKIIEPVEIAADSGAASSVLWAITGLYAAEHIEDTPVNRTRARLQSPQLTVWFGQDYQGATRPAGATLTFGIYDDIRRQSIFLETSQPAGLAKVAASSFDSLNKSVKDLRTREVLKIDPAQVTRIALTRSVTAATQPVTRPASEQSVVVERRRQDLTLGPALPLPTTQPATLPGDATTQPTTQPATTQPGDEPASDWIYAATGEEGRADDISALLDRLNPLRATAFVAAPADQVDATYRLVITTTQGATTTEYVVTVRDPGDARPLIGAHQGLDFELPRDMLDNLSALLR